MMSKEEKLKVVLVSDIEKIAGNDRLRNEILNEVHRGKLPVYQTDKVEIIPEEDDEGNENE